MELVNYLRGLLIRAAGGFWHVVLVSLILYPLYKRIFLGLGLVVVGAAISYLLTRQAAREGSIGKWLSAMSACRWLGSLTIAGFLLRLPLIVTPPPAVGDFGTYLATGESIAAGRGFGGYLFYPPGPSAWLAPWIKLFGPNPHALTAVQCLTSLATVWMIYAAFARCSRPAAMWASGVVALYPSIILWSGTLGHETLVMFLEAALFWMIARASNGLQLRWLLLCGATIGLTALVRPTFVIAPALIGLALWLAGNRFERSLMAGLVVMAAALAVISPWTWRNYQRFHGFALISTNFGVTLLSSSHPASDGIYMETMHIGKGLNPIQQDKLQTRMAIDAIRGDLPRFARLTFKRVVFMWGGESSIADGTYGVHTPPLLRAALRAFSTLGWIVFACACWLGARRLRASWRFYEVPVLWSLLFTAFLFVLHAFIEPAARHHMTAVPLLAGIYLPAHERALKGKPAKAAASD